MPKIIDQSLQQLKLKVKTHRYLDKFITRYRCNILKIENDMKKSSYEYIRYNADNFLAFSMKLHVLLNL